MAVLLRARGSLTLDTFWQSVNPLAPAEGPAVVDLRGVTFVDAFAIVGLACLIARRMAKAGDIELHVPSQRDSGAYLSRMRFDSFLEGLDVQVDGRLPDVRPRDQSGFLVELTNFNDTLGGDQIANVVWQRLHGHVDIGVLVGMHEATSELGANVYEHAESSLGGFVAAQTFHRSRSDESLLIAVGDPGSAWPPRCPDGWVPSRTTRRSRGPLSGTSQAPMIQQEVKVWRTWWSLPSASEDKSSSAAAAHDDLSHRTVDEPESCHTCRVRSLVRGSRADHGRDGGRDDCLGRSTSTRTCEQPRPGAPHAERLATLTARQPGGGRVRSASLERPLVR